MMNFDMFQTLGRDGADATLRSFGAVSTGLQAAAAESADFAKRSFEQGTSAAQRLFGARSVDAAVQIQGEYLRTAYDDVVAQTGRMGDLAATLAKDVAAPLEGLFVKPVDAR